MKVFKAFLKPFEAPQRSVKIKIYINFCFNITFWNTRGEIGENIQYYVAVYNLYDVIIIFFRTWKFCIWGFLFCDYVYWNIYNKIFSLYICNFLLTALTTKVCSKSIWILCWPICPYPHDNTRKTGLPVFSRGIKWEHWSEIALPENKYRCESNNQKP